MYELGIVFLLHKLFPLSPFFQTPQTLVAGDKAVGTKNTYFHNKQI